MDAQTHEEKIATLQRSDARRCSGAAQKFLTWHATTRRRGMTCCDVAATLRCEDRYRLCFARDFFPRNRAFILRAFSSAALRGRPSENARYWGNCFLARRQIFCPGSRDIRISCLSVIRSSLHTNYVLHVENIYVAYFIQSFI